GHAVVPEVSHERRPFRELLHGRAARWWQRRDALDGVDRGATDGRGADLSAGGGERRALVRRGQRDHVAERRQRAVTGLVEMPQEPVDDDPTLRVRDEVHLATRLLSLHGAELLTQPRRRLLDRPVRVVGRVRTATGRVREVADLALVGAVAEGLHVERY